MANQENEIKLKLSHLNYEELINHFTKLNKFKTLLQKNYYFDFHFEHQKFIMKKNGVGIRIREKENKYIFTIKIAQSSDKYTNLETKRTSALSQKDEYECIVNPDMAKKIINQKMGIEQIKNNQCEKITPISPIEILQDLFKKKIYYAPEDSKLFNPSQLTILASNETRRSIIAFGSKFNLELDNSTYAGENTDYRGYELELEIELPDFEQAVTQIKELFKIYNISFQPSDYGKTSISFLLIENPKKIHKLLKEGTLEKK